MKSVKQNLLGMTVLAGLFSINFVKDWGVLPLSQCLLIAALVMSTSFCYKASNIRRSIFFSGKGMAGIFAMLAIIGIAPLVIFAWQGFPSFKFFHLLIMGTSSWCIGGAIAKSVCVYAEVRARRNSTNVLQ